MAWYGELARPILLRPPDPCGGQALALHFLIPPSATGLQFGRFHPWRTGVVAWHSELARRILLRPTPIPAGDKPPRYIFSFRPQPSVQDSEGFALGEPASRLIGGPIFVP